ncbi:Gfo/Idh/MocA family oxidoreductase [Actinokineospora soli]|uniref:Gfo/Idh/MocA family oxidoreductase n=1 Tax=Actinokineospora soli TaxID=1048753 RepID=A0ABW2TUN3_9PSEU
MLGTLVVGLGRAGAHLHLPVVRTLRDLDPAPAPPIVVFDPVRSVQLGPDVVVARDPAHAALLTDPATTVVHVCTPPSARRDPVAAFAAAGFRRFLVEKPLAADPAGLSALLDLARAADLDVVPVGPWRHSELTRRLLDLRGALGRPVSIAVRQAKPRFTRTLSGDAHPSAFDVEAPHSVGLALRLGGPARVVAAGSSDMLLGAAVFPGLGGAWLALEHEDGLRTEISTDLTAPVRERRVTVEFERGTAVGHFAVSAADEYAQLRVRTPSATTRSVFRDDSLTAFTARAYRHFAGVEPMPGELASGAAVVSLIADAKRLAAPVGAAR